MSDYGPICCRGGCCGPGSYCCGHPDNIHEHTEEDIMSERDDMTEQAFHYPTTVHLPAARQPDPAHQMLDDMGGAGRGFAFLLELQRDVEAKWGRLVDPADPEAVSSYVRDVVLCATDELHEVLAEVNWKPWKDKRGIKDMAAFREEMADVLHFILDLYLAAGLNGRDIVADYVAKHYKNLERTTDQEYRNS